MLRLVADHARTEAEKRGLAEYESEELISEATEIVEDIFGAITWERVENGVIKSRDAIVIWRHRTINDQKDDWRYMGFARSELQNAAERYLGKPWLHCREIDWLIVNVLVYAEYQATLDFVRARMMPLSRYITGKIGSGAAVAWSLLWRCVVTGLKWLIWLGIFVLSFELSPIAPIALGILTVWWQWRNWKARKKFERVLSSMTKTYASLSTISQSWRVVWDELQKSREAGAVWDGIVYRLVEDRMRAMGNVA